ncbi:hypothetical protein BGX29_009002 [Mortierella sp. GBA35]|nr:hypothetical protein BGX29_009002 [Mortierella sp. GBA35]
MSHYQHQQQHYFQQQQLPQMYNTASYQQQPQQQQQQQYEQLQHPAMASYNPLQVPTMPFGMPSIQGYNANLNQNNNSIDLGCEQTYFQGLDMSIPQDASNCQNNNNSHPPSLISIRRDSGFHSLDELSIGIMASNQDDREDLKETLYNTLQTAAMMSTEIINDNTNNNNNNSSSFFLSTPTSPTSSTTSPTSSTTSPHLSSSSGATAISATTSTPLIVSISFGIDYTLTNEQRHFLNQQQQQQQHLSPVIDGIQSNGFQASAVGSNSDFSMMQAQQSSFSMILSEQQRQQPPQQQQPTLLSPLQYHPRQGQIQRPRQRKPMLQIMTAPASEQTMVFNNNTTNSASEFPVSPMSAQWESPAMVPSPSMSAANNIVRAGQQPAPHNCPWGFISSPVESSFSSGSSTPLFASPSSSYTHSEIATSCHSSRAASPSFGPSSLYENFLANDRRIKRENDSSNLIIRSRKSSTSSTSSMASQRRGSTLRESAMTPASCASSSPATSNGITTTTAPSSSSTGTHQCPKCGQRFAGPAVLVRHIESIHDKLLWNCVGCKSNLSRRDAVTRHINLSPMGSICRAVGTIGQIKTSNGAEVHYEISSYRAKPLDEVMNRMGKKISTTLRKEIDRAKAAAAAAVMQHLQHQHQQQFQQQHLQQQHFNQQYRPYYPMEHHIKQEMCDIEMLKEEDEEEMTKKRRRPSLVVDETLLGRKLKM